MVAAKAAIRYECGVCGKRITAEQAIYSTHTKARYCAFDMAACRKRAAARKRKGEA